MIVKPLVELTERKKGKKPKLIKLEIKSDITKNTNEIQSIIREYFKNLYSSKLKNVEKNG
jgi:hypothetical protein